MCRSIKRLANLTPPASDEEIRAAALQFVRKLAGTARLSRANEAAFNGAVDEVTIAATAFLRRLRTDVPSRTREAIALQAQRWRPPGGVRAS